MCGCSFDRLVQFVNERLDLGGRLKLYDHLDRCAICRDAVCELSSDRGTPAPSGTTSATAEGSQGAEEHCKIPGCSSGPVMLENMWARWGPGIWR